MLTLFPTLTLPDSGSGLAPTLGHPLVDAYLESVHARLRPNSTLAVVYDLKVFFTVIDVDPLDVRRRHVLEFIRAQRTGSLDKKVVPFDQSAGLALSTIRRRLSSVAGFYSHLCALGELDHNPVQRGMPVRAPVTRDRRVIPLVRPVRHLPKILDHDEVIKLVAALRKDRDRAMIDAMLLAGLRRCEVLGLRIEDIRWGERRLFIANGKGGHQRIVPISQRFFDTLRSYLNHERPKGTETEFVFVVLKGPNRGQPLSPKGLDQIMLGARQRAGLEQPLHPSLIELHQTWREWAGPDDTGRLISNQGRVLNRFSVARTVAACARIAGIGHVHPHQLRHTLATQSINNGMSLEAVSAMLGHKSMRMTLVYARIADRTVADEYFAAADKVDQLYTTHLTTSPA